MNEIGYRQGKVNVEKFKPATKKQILFARLNTYELVSFAKPMNDKYFHYHIVDINFRLSNDDSVEAALEMLEDTAIIKNSIGEIRTMCIEKFLIFLCIHHYREATMIYKIVLGEDLILYKYVDIHTFIRKSTINWEKFIATCSKINREKEVYHTLYYTELLFPNTVQENVFHMFSIFDLSFLNCYRGRDNSNEIYEWKRSFHQRFFSNARRIEALENIQEENGRFKEIRNKLMS